MPPLTSLTSLLSLSLLSSTLATPITPRDLAYGVVSKITNPDAISKWYTSSTSTGESQKQNYQYQCFDGTLGSYRPFNEWVSFDAMWETNKPKMSGNSEEEMRELKQAILQNGKEAQLDPRLILGIVMQESTGDVHVQSPDGIHSGLMQMPTSGSTATRSTPDTSNTNTNTNSTSDISLQIQQGVFGLTSPKQQPGLAQLFAGESWISSEWYGNPYATIRLYNSGKIQDDNLNNSPYDPLTKAYVDDVANRLLGWDGGYEGCKESVKCGLREVGDCK